MHTYFSFFALVHENRFAHCKFMCHAAKWSLATHVYWHFWCFGWTKDNRKCEKKKYEECVRCEFCYIFLYCFVTYKLHQWNLMSYALFRFFFFIVIFFAVRHDIMNGRWWWRKAGKVHSFGFMTYIIYPAADSKLIHRKNTHFSFHFDIFAGFILLLSSTNTSMYIYIYT